MARTPVARPKADLPPAAALRAMADGAGRLALKVTPGARVEGIAISGGQVLVKVRAQPEDGAANAAVLALLAGALGCPPSALKLLRGGASRQKSVQLPQMPQDQSCSAHRPVR